MITALDNHNAQERRNCKFSTLYHGVRKKLYSVFVSMIFIIKIPNGEADRSQKTLNISHKITENTTLSTFSVNTTFID